MTFSLKNLFFFLALFLLSIPINGLFAQQVMATDAPKVFLDCQTRCYEEHIRSELSYLNIMRDRQTADVYILLTSLRTAAGGREWNLFVKGQGRFATLADTLIFYSDADASDGQVQDLQARKLQQALLPYILKTSLADKLNVKVNQAQTSVSRTAIAAIDPWNSWLFSLGGNFNLDGQESYTGLEANGRMNASRVTDKNKFNLSYNYNYRRRRFSLEDAEDYISKTRRWNVWSIYVFSISDHWSVGGFGNVSSSTVNNIDLSYSVRPALEYNIFPYSQATKRQFTFLYNVGPFRYNYTDTTIFSKTEEWLLRQNIEVSYRQLEEWGRLELNTEFENYLHDWGLLSLSFNPEIEWNLFRGFNLNMGGRISMVRNQLSIPQKSASDEEVLLQLRQLRSNYLISVNMGINYRFGSRTNNVVNTRF